MAATNVDVFCASCKEKINLIKGSSVTCIGNCKKTYHKRCSRISDVNYASYVTDLKKIWYCVNCKEQEPTAKSKKVTHTNSPIVTISPAITQKSTTQSTPTTSSQNGPPTDEYFRDQLNLMSKNIEKILMRQEKCENKLNEISNKLQEQINQLTTKVADLEKENIILKEREENFNYRLNYFEQNKIIKNIEICGIEPQKNENLKEIVLKLSDKVGSNLKNSNIIAVYRKTNRSQKKNGGTHPIITIVDDVKK